MLDGGQNTNDMDGSMQVYTPSFAGDRQVVSFQARLRSPTGVMPTPLDSVEEFKVNTANQTADFNSSAGAQVQVVTKRGTNSWHGYWLRILFDNNLTLTPGTITFLRQPLPFIITTALAAGAGRSFQKTFWGKDLFLRQLEGFRWKNSATYERAVPTANMRAGILTLNVCNAACQADPKASPPVPTQFNLNNVPIADRPELRL